MKGTSERAVPTGLAPRPPPTAAVGWKPASKETLHGAKMVLSVRLEKLCFMWWFTAAGVRGLNFLCYMLVLYRVRPPAPLSCPSPHSTVLRREGCGDNTYPLPQSLRWAAN